MQRYDGSVLSLNVLEVGRSDGAFAPRQGPLGVVRPDDRDRRDVQRTPESELGAGGVLMCRQQMRTLIFARFIPPAHLLRPKAF